MELLLLPMCAFQGVNFTFTFYIYNIYAPSMLTQVVMTLTCIQERFGPRFPWFSLVPPDKCLNHTVTASFHILPKSSFTIML